MNRISDFGLRVVRQTSTYATCHCPLHNDKHASALVYLDNMWFVCFVCHLSMPLEKLLIEAGIGEFSIERLQQVDFDLLEDGYKVQPLTIEAITYLQNRGIEDFPDYLCSPLNNSGVGFAFRDMRGKVLGAQVRLFPQNVSGKSWRYVFEGKRLGWFGNVRPHFAEHFKLFVFEKAFATVKAEVAARKFGLPIAPISAVGSHFRSELLDIITVDTTVFFDNDTAGLDAARKMKRLTGARVIIPGKPLDELTIDEMGKYLEKYMT